MAALMHIVLRLTASLLCAEVRLKNINGAANAVKLYNHVSAQN